MDYHIYETHSSEVKFDEKGFLPAAVCLLLALLAPVLAEGEITVTEIQKYGNLVLSLPGTAFL
ncbi:MAG: hypothetical protein IKP72_07610 [Clostridia bacterium]|nr:hypothetical protein [Clostridia bacterium]